MSQITELALGYVTAYIEKPCLGPAPHVTADIRTIHNDLKKI